MDANTPTEPLPPAQESQSVSSQQTSPVQPQPPLHEPFYKRYGLAFAISTLVLGSFVILAFVGVGAFAVGNFVTHAGAGISHIFEQGRVPGLPGQPGQGYGSKPGHGQGQGQGQGAVPGPGTNSGNQVTVVRGSITSISGPTWTIETLRGASVTVQLTSSTQFGSPSQSESSSAFTVGQEVIVVGSRSGDIVTADRVLDLSGFKQPLPTTPGTPVTPGPSPSK